MDLSFSLLVYSLSMLKYSFKCFKCSNFLFKWKSALQGEGRARPLCSLCLEKTCNCLNKIALLIDSNGIIETPLIAISSAIRRPYLVRLKDSRGNYSEFLKTSSLSRSTPPPKPPRLDGCPADFKLPTPTKRGCCIFYKQPFVCRSDTCEKQNCYFLAACC